MLLSNPRREGFHGPVIQPIDSNRRVHMIISSNLLLLTRNTLRDTRVKGQYSCFVVVVVY